MSKKDRDRGIKGYTDLRGGWHSTWEEAIKANIGYDDHPCQDEPAVDKAVDKARAEGKELSPD